MNRFSSLPVGSPLVATCLCAVPAFAALERHALAVVLNKSGVYPFGHAEATLGISARGTLARSAHGMEYAVANGLVGDGVELLIEAEAPRE